MTEQSRSGVPCQHTVLKDLARDFNTGKIWTAIHSAALGLALGKAYLGRHLQ